MTDRGLAKGVAAALLVTVATQIFYITIVSGSANEALRPITWFTELFAFCAVTVLALALAAHSPSQAVVWSIVALSGLLNVLQVGIGLSMFAPAMEAQESVPELFSAVLAGAFFLYFLAKLLTGIAAILLSHTAITGRGSGPFKAFGGVTAIAGLCAVGLSIAAMIDSEAWTFAAGGAGTAATALVAVAILLKPTR